MNWEFKKNLMDSMGEFAQAVRMNRDYDDEQFENLKKLLSKLACELSDKEVLDKDLALNLYTLPQIVRNMFLTYDGPIDSRPERFNRLEDAWIDLDELVIECLQPPNI
jgi:hypothetical protein